jgi:hypothetical protein
MLLNRKINLTAANCTGETEGDENTGGLNSQNPLFPTTAPPSFRFYTFTLSSLFSSQPKPKPKW